VADLTPVATRLDGRPSPNPNVMIEYGWALKHLEYWSDFSLPVLIIICHPQTREAYWAEFSHAAAERLKKGWKIRIPMRNRLSRVSFAFKEITSRNHSDNLLDLAVQAWVHAKHLKRVEFCGMFGMPRDYGSYRHLIQVGGEQVMLHWLYARYGRFELKELRDAVRDLPANRIYGPKLMLCLVSESAEALELGIEAEKILATESGIQVVRLIYRRAWSSVGELNTDGNITVEYYRGEPVCQETLAGDYIP
jgi:hypothetical protein